MFKLSRIVNGRINTSEPHDITLTTVGGLAADVPAFVPVVIHNGSLAVVNATTTSVATHILCKPGKAGDTKVWAIDITPDMVFECPLTADVNAAVGAYTEVAITASGTAGTAPASVESGKPANRGAILYDTIPAKSKSGEKVFVFFKD